MYTDCKRKVDNFSMVSFLLQIFFDPVITLIETVLFFYLLAGKLELKPSRCLMAVCFLLEFSLVTAMNYLSVPDGLRMWITLFLHIAIAYVISTSPVTRKIFWGSIYMVIVVFADTVTFLSGGLLTDYSASERLYEYPITYVMTFIYLLVCFCSVFLLTRTRKQNLILPWYLQAVFFMMIAFGIVSVELLLDLLLYLKQIDRFIENILFFSIAVFILILFLSIFLLHAIGLLYQKNLELTEENRQKLFEKQQYELISNTNQMLRTWKHDFHHYISALQAMTESRQWEQIQEYLHEISHELEKGSWLVRTGNSVIDAVLSSKLPRIQQCGIAFTHSIFLPESLPLDNLELTSLLGNLLDNAIDACEKLEKTQEKYIRLEIKPYNQFLFFDISNSSSGNHRFDVSNELISTKKEIGHGIGLKRIKQIVSDASGFLTLAPEKDSFHVNIVIPLSVSLNPPTGGTP